MTASEEASPFTAMLPWWFFLTGIEVTAGNEAEVTSAPVTNATLDIVNVGEASPAGRIWDSSTCAAGEQQRDAVLYLRYLHQDDEGDLGLGGGSKGKNIFVRLVSTAGTANQPLVRLQRVWQVAIHSVNLIGKVTLQRPMNEFLACSVFLVVLVLLVASVLLTCQPRMPAMASSPPPHTRSSIPGR